KRARRPIADHNDKRSGANSGRELAVKAMQPYRMLERGRGGAVEQRAVFFRQEIELVFDAYIERLFTIVHPHDQTNGIIAEYRSSRRSALIAGELARTSMECNWD